MREKKLRIGDKIRWLDVFPYGTVFTIMDIDTSVQRGGNEVLFQWEKNGRLYQDWSYSIASLNYVFNRGKIILVERDMLPHKELLKFSMI